MAPSKPLDTKIREELTALIKTMTAGNTYWFTWSDVDTFTPITFPTVNIYFSEDNATAELPANYTYPSKLQINLEITIPSELPALSTNRAVFEDAHSKARQDVLTILGKDDVCFANTTTPLVYIGYEKDNKADNGSQFANCKQILKFTTYITRNRDNPSIPV